LPPLCSTCDDAVQPKASGGAASAESVAAGGQGHGFNTMNDVAARMLADLTAPMRFEGPLNVDLNEITMNLVPFPRLHYLVSSLSPMFPTDRGASNTTSLFSSAFAKENQLIRADPKHSTLSSPLMSSLPPHYCRMVGTLSLAL